MSKFVEIKPSGIHGNGLFACRQFEAGEVVLRWDVSHLIPNESLSSLSPDERKYTHPFDETRTLLVQSPERFVNHSCDNNTIVKDFCDVAIKTIGLGDEITSNYGEDGSGSQFSCSCRSKNCRQDILAT
jgi:SET domain-containing protein